MEHKTFFLKPDPKATEKLVRDEIMRFNERMKKQHPGKSKAYTLKKTHQDTLIMLLNKVHYSHAYRQYYSKKFAGALRTNNKSLSKIMNSAESTVYRQLQRFKPEYIHEKTGAVMPGLGVITEKIYHGTNASYELLLSGKLLASYGNREFAMWLEGILTTHFKLNPEKCPGLYDQIDACEQLISYADAPQGYFQAGFNPATGIIEVAAPGSQCMIAFCIDIMDGTFNNNVKEGTVNYFRMVRIENFVPSPVINSEVDSLDGTLRERWNTDADSKPCQLSEKEKLREKKNVAPENFVAAAETNQNKGISSGRNRALRRQNETNFAELKLQNDILHHCVGSLLRFALNLLWGGSGWNERKLEIAYKFIFNYFLDEKKRDNRQSWYSIQGRFIEIIHLSHKKATQNPAGFITNPDVYFDPAFNGGFARTRTWFDTVIVPDRKKKKYYHSYSQALAKASVLYAQAVKTNPNTAHEVYRQLLQYLGKKSAGGENIQQTFIAATRDGIPLDKEFFNRQWQNFQQTIDYGKSATSN